MRPIMIVALSCACSKGDSKAAAGETSELGSSTFALKADGVGVHGGTIDDLQLFNAAHTIPGNGGNDVLLWLSDENFPGTKSAAHALRLQFSKQLGDVTASALFDTQLDAQHTARYVGKLAINVTSLTATRLVGRFSGDLNLSPDTPNVPKPTDKLSEGTFDVPFATSKVVPM